MHSLRMPIDTIFTKGIPMIRRNKYISLQVINKLFYISKDKTSIPIIFPLNTLKRYMTLKSLMPYFFPMSLLT